MKKIQRTISKRKRKKGGKKDSGGGEDGNILDGADKPVRMNKYGPPEESLMVACVCLQTAFA